jgi:hypothetical protein
MLVALLHSYIVKRRDNVDLRKVLHPFEVVQSLLNQRERVSVLN